MHATITGGPAADEMTHGDRTTKGSNIPGRVLGAIVDAAGLAVVVIDADHSVRWANAAGAALFDLGARSGGEPTDPLRAVLDQVPHHLLSGEASGTWAGDLTVAAAPGTATICEVTVLAHADGADRGRNFIGVLATDVSGQRARLDSLAQRADRDPMTGLLNRPASIDRLTDLLGRLEGGAIAAIALVDIDHLGDVNDVLGHDLGDRLLVSVARRLATTVGPDDLLARTAGDEFLVVRTDLSDDAAATEFGDRVRRALAGRLTIDELEIAVSVSVGVTVAEGRAGDGERATREQALDLVSQAHTAMRAAKQHGRARSVRFRHELMSLARDRTELAAALSTALRDDQFEVEYQPIFSSVSERAEGAEALLRWRHPDRGRLEAHDFIAIAEQIGTIVPIGDWVLQQACAATRRWIDEGAVGAWFAVHVNVTRLELADPAFVGRVAEMLTAHRLQPRQLVLETGEASVIGHDADDVTRTVRSFRRMGVRIAIDNFGTASNALSLMTEMGADVLKLDGSLALPTGASDTDTRVVRSLVALAHALGMEVVAERVTGLEQLRRLRAAGCDLVQGHLVGPPAPADQLRARMQR